MNDLSIAVIVMATVAIASAVLTARCLRPPPRATLEHPGDHRPALVVSIAVAVGFLMIYLTKDRLFWAMLIPFSSMIIWSNLTVIALAIAAGASFRLPNRPRWRQTFSAITLGVLAMATLIQPIMQPVLRPIAGGNQWDDQQVCIQSQTNTCSAAAAATLLRTAGVEMTEAKMVQLCLTDARGTPSSGLWRGLCLATRGRDVHPEVTNVATEHLIEKGPWPSVLVVGLPRYGADPRYVKRYGWAPGFRHSVVIFGVKDDGMVDIGDPAIGRESWSQEDLKILYRGEAITLRE